MVREEIIEGWSFSNLCLIYSFTQILKSLLKQLYVDLLIRAPDVKLKVVYYVTAYIRRSDIED